MRIRRASVCNVRVTCRNCRCHTIRFRQFVVSRVVTFGVIVIVFAVSRVS